MKVYFQFIFIVFLILNLSACRKESDKVMIFGRVTDHSTGLPVAVTKVEILNAKGFDITLFGEPDDDEMVTLTDNNGNYTYSYNSASSNFYPQVNFSNFLYLPERVKGEIDLQNGKRSFLLNIALRPQANLIFEIEDVAPFDSLKRFDISHAYHYTYIGDVEIENWKELSKPGGKTTGKTVTAGGQYVRVKYIVETYSERHVIRDSVYCPAFQTTTYRIER